MTNERSRPSLSGKRSRSLALAALLSATFAAHATGLGDISVRSHLGERLRVEVQLRGGDASPRGVECFHLSNALADNSGLPRLRHASMSVLQNPPRLVITSRDTIFEPAIELAVFYGCGVYLSRSYTVLLSPREIAAIAPPLADAADERRLAPPPATPAPRPAAERRVRALLAGETPEEMAQRLYPRSEAYRKRFLRELLALNPGRLAADELGQPLADGETLKIPPRFVPPAKKPAPAPAPAAPAAPPPAAAPATPPAETTPPPAADRLVLSPPDEASVPVQATPEQARLEMDQRLRDVIGQARALSNELSAMQTEFPNPPPEIRTRLLEMETRLARMELAAVRIKLSAAATDPATAQPAAQAAPAEPPAPPPAAVAQPAPATDKPAAPAVVAEEDGHGFWWGLGILLAFAAALAAYLARNSLRRGEGNPLDVLMPGRDAAVPATQGEAPASATTESPKRTASTVPQDDLDRPGPPPEFERAMPGEIEIVEVAHVLAIFGRAPAAIDVLTEFIGQNPDKALNPSLYLLKLYKQTDRREEFHALATRLHADYNVLEISWDDPIEEMAPIEPSARDYREIARELEKIPHVYSRISEQWGSRQCLDYLNELLRDNRAGQRQGLPLAATNEVLNLIAILQRDIPAESETGKS